MDAEDYAIANFIGIEAEHLALSVTRAGDNVRSVETVLAKE
jgi:hypothetical protein